MLNCKGNANYLNISEFGGSVANLSMFSGCDSPLVLLSGEIGYFNSTSVVDVLNITETAKVSSIFHNGTLTDVNILGTVDLFEVNGLVTNLVTYDGS